MATIDVKDAANATQTIQQPNANGRAAASASRPVVLSNEDKAALDALTPTLGTATATITNGTSLSASIDLGATGYLQRVAFPSAWTAAVMTFQVSYDNATFNDLYDSTGEVMLNTAGASRSIVVDPAVFYGARYIKVRSGTSASAVNQLADRTLTLITASR